VSIARNAQRDIDIYKRRCRGESLETLSAEYGIGIRAVARVVANMRQRFPIPSSDELRSDLLNQLNELRAHVGTLALTAVDPDNVDPDTDQPLPHYGLQMIAAKRTLEVQHRIARLLGLDAPKEVAATQDVTVRYELAGVDLDDV
jgi:hypothetical protein